MLLTPHEQVSGSLALCEKSDEGQPCSSPLDEGWLSLLSPLTPGWRSQALGTSHVSSLPGSPGPPCIQCPSSPRRRPSPHLDTPSPPSPRPTAQACRRCRLSPSSLSAVRSGDPQHRLDPLPSPLPALALGRDARSLRRPSRAASGPTMAEGAGAARTDDGGTPTGATGSTRSRGSISFTDSSVRPPSLAVVCPRRAITDRLEPPRSDQRRRLPRLVVRQRTRAPLPRRVVGPFPPAQLHRVLAEHLAGSSLDPRDVCILARRNGPHPRQHAQSLVRRALSPPLDLDGPPLLDD